MTEARQSPEQVVSARWIEALDRQATIVMAIFARAGFEPVAPPVIQPADVFLDLIGEDLRARTYVFTDPDGEELCLRPDLTIPACRHYLARVTGVREQIPTARYAYNGVVFRYQPTGGTMIRPREFRQAGIESFAAADPAKADAEILALTVEAVRASGLRAFRLRVGDISIFNALLDAIPMPDRWRYRLKHHFRHPDAFRRQLQRLTRNGATETGPMQALLARVAGSSDADALAAIEAHIADSGGTISGTRSIEEIAEQLRDRARDLDESPLDAASAHLIESYLRIETTAENASVEIARLLAGTRVDIRAAIEGYQSRLQLAAQEGIDISQAQFSAGFGRAFEYYTGFVFEILSSTLDDATPIGGGGRYDTLVEAISGGKRVPAVGSAIHTERLLLAVRGGQP